MKKYTKSKIKTICFILIFLILILLILSWLKSSRPEKKMTDELSPRQEFVSNNLFDGKIFFNTEINSRLFSKKIIELIESSKNSIEMSVYSISTPEIISSLIKKAGAGIDTTIIIPKKKEEFMRNLLNNTKVKLLALGELNDSGSEEDFVHHKFMIIDSKLDSAKIIFGSSNFTPLQEKYDAGFLIESSDKNVISAYKNEFDLLKKGNEGTKKLRNFDYRPYDTKINYNDGYFEIWFGPGFKENSIKYRMLELIKGATKEIDIMAWIFNDADIAAGLILKAKQGVKIKIIADDFNFWSEDSQLQEIFHYNKNSNSNIELVSDAFDNLLIEEKYYKQDTDIVPGFNPYLHHHTMIIDNNILVTGTNNWTFNGFYRNDEDMIITNINTLVQEFSNFFKLEYTKNKGETLNFKLGQGDKKLEIMDSLNPKNTVILYREPFSEEPGTVCLKSTIEKIKTVVVPEKCITDQTKIYIIDSNFKLLRSNYLSNSL